jgi:cytochrome d ubiquinol oxidase subunit I
VSPVGAGQVATSLLAFMAVYAVIFSAGIVYILRLLATGPSPDEPADTDPPVTPRPPGYALGAAPAEGADA